MHDTWYMVRLSQGQMLHFVLHYPSLRWSFKQILNTNYSFNTFKFSSSGGSWGLHFYLNFSFLIFSREALLQSFIFRSFAGQNLLYKWKYTVQTFTVSNLRYKSLMYLNSKIKITSEINITFKDNGDHKNEDRVKKEENKLRLKWCQAQVKLRLS